MPAEQEILILGGGVAGVAAAARLSHAGRKVVLLEARPRLGGRIWTQHIPELEQPIELGAEFVHGCPPEIMEFARDGRVPLDELRGAMWCFQAGRLEHCPQDQPEPGEVFDRLDPQAPDQSFRQYLDRLPGPQEDKLWSLGFVEGFHAADAGRISLQSLRKGVEADRKIEGDRQFRPASGYDALVQALEARIDRVHCDIRLGTVVREIAWRPGQVTVTAESAGSSATFEAAQAIVTLPLGILQASVGDAAFVRFSPPLREKKAALDRLAMGPVIRVSLHFREAFWTESAPDLSFLFSHEAFFPTWWTRGPERGAVLTGWAAGPRGRVLSDKSAGEIRAHALNALAQFFGKSSRELEERLLGAYTHDWQSDPFSRGGYSYALVGGAEAPAALAEPLAGTLFFAGEATDNNGHNATVHGAIASGYRVAQQVLS